MNDNETLYLSSEGRYTIFEFRDTRIKMISSKALDKYLNVTDFRPQIGYIAVMTKFKCWEEPEEEYIDILSTLDELLIDRDSFLNPIKNIEIRYDDKRRDCI